MAEMSAILKYQLGACPERGEITVYDGPQTVTFFCIGTAWCELARSNN